MTLQDLLKTIATVQQVYVLHGFKTIYTGDIEEWEDRGTFKDWKVTRVYVGLFGTLTINIEKERITK